MTQKHPYLWGVTIGFLCIFGLFAILMAGFADYGNALKTATLGPASLVPWWLMARWRDNAELRLQQQEVLLEAWRIVEGDD